MTSVGDYELEAQIGAGAAGTVWKAHRRGPIMQVVALKRLRGAASTPADLERLRREATVLTALDHPHVVRVYEVLDDGEGLALAMQFAPGGSLEGLVEERRRLTAGEVVAVAAPIADALASAHRRAVVHGDVKPANILFTSDGEPLLGDFGVARTMGRFTSDQITGTVHYLAPELMDGAAPDARTDIYALAVVCYEALTGQVPYDGAVPMAVVRAAESGFHAPLAGQPGVPAALADVVEQAMAREPGRRFASAEDFARALRASVPHDEILLPGTVTTPASPADDPTRGTRTFGPRPPRPEPRLPVRRYRLPTAFFVVLVLAGALYLIRGPLRPEDDDGGGQDPGQECAGQEQPDVGPDAQVVSGDPEGNGCVVYGVYEERTLEGGERRMLLTIEVGELEKRIVVGDAGDRLFLGDWDCDGDDTPGIYRRTNGEVQYFNVWPEVADERYEPDSAEPAPASGTASLAPGGNGAGGEDGAACDRIAVA
ncbi:MAG: serine/threonine-protein kinase [Acidimicrobiales bacterium]